jgi:hypothetical protein
LLQIDVNWALFWATLALVGVTIFYAIQTWRLVMVPFTPRLNASLSTTTIREDRTHGLTILIKNIGNSMALCIKGKYTINKKPSQKIDTTRSLKLNEMHSINLSLPPIEEKGYYENNPIVIKLRLDFRNILKQKDKDEVTLDVSHFVMHIRPEDIY